MDSVTHIVLGACIGEAIGGKKLGKKAMLWGAAANSLPDIDVLASGWLDMAPNLLAHRGFTHSFLFLVLMTPLLAIGFNRIYKKYELGLNNWMLLFGVNMFCHILIDAFTSYGTGWFEPFSHMRVSFNSVFVADPIYTIGPLVASIALLILKRTSPKRAGWAKFGIISTAVYIAICFVNKNTMDDQVSKSLERQQITYKRAFSTPAPLNNILWYVVVQTDSGFYAGHRSLWDKQPDISLKYYSQNEQLLQTVTNNTDLQLLKRFSQGYYTLEMQKDTLIFNDLRFGMITNWDDSPTKFVFHYYLQNPESNKLVIQRGRFSNIDGKAFSNLWHRIQGI